MTYDTAVRSLWFVVVVTVAGCGVGVQGGGDTGVVDAAATTRATWQILDLTTGAVSSSEVVPGTAADLGYRDTKMLFRLVPAGPAVLGQAPGTLGRQADEAASAVTLPPFYIGVFEVTRAQWRRLAGTQPWVGLPGPVEQRDDLPATGVSFAALQIALATHATRLALPQAGQWEAAARAGTATVFPWGDDPRASVAGRYAATADTGNALRPVGSLTANALGLYDVCGNAWEFTADGGLCGGSWADALILARPANRAAIESNTVHPAIGVRLVFTP